MKFTKAEVEREMLRRGIKKAEAEKEQKEKELASMSDDALEYLYTRLDH